MIRWILPLILLLVASSLPAQTKKQLSYITAFNRLYGYVKYFHPSDEAAAIDWDKFAILWMPGNGEVPG